LHRVILKITSHIRLQAELFRLTADTAGITALPPYRQSGSTRFSSTYCSYHYNLHSLYLKKVLKLISFRSQTRVTLNTLFVACRISTVGTALHAKGFL